MDKKLLYQKAYRELENSTPLRYDCGLLCQNACCKGDDETGMYVFPGEEVMLRSEGAGPEIRPSGFVTASGAGIGLALCRGHCKRSERPLSCRIFPLTPYISAGGRLKIIIDPRAVPLCPIAGNSGIKEMNPFFVRRVERVLRLLVQDSDIREFTEWLSVLIDDFAVLFRKKPG